MQRLKLREIAQIYGRKPKQFRKYVHEFMIPHIRLGRDMMFDPQQVEKFLEELTLSRMTPDPDLKPNTPKPRRKPKPADGRYADMLGLKG